MRDFESLAGPLIAVSGLGFSLCTWHEIFISSLAVLSSVRKDLRCPLSARENSLLLSLNFKFKSNLNYLNYTVGGGLSSAGTSTFGCLAAVISSRWRCSQSFTISNESAGDSSFFPDDGVLF